tara:strand:+ start:588 stop:869 length:282 start_codon:yes stop_codon:yes gene_type:complete
MQPVLETTNQNVIADKDVNLRDPRDRVFFNAYRYNKRRKKMGEHEFLREIANDKETPRQMRKVNTDGLFETTDCSDPNHQCTCGSQPVTLIED